MNATQNLLMLMQQMSGAMSLPNVSAKPSQNSVSFEDMLSKASGNAPKDKAPVKDGQSAETTEKGEAPKDAESTEPVTENGEEKTAYQLVGAAVNPDCRGQLPGPPGDRGGDRGLRDRTGDRGEGR